MMDSGNFRHAIFAAVVVASFITGGESLFGGSSDEEAPYKVIKEHKGYEERLYKSQKWVCSRITDNNYGASDNLKQFYNLFNYKNDRGVTIPMTIPVNMKKTVVDGQSIYEMCLYIPRKFQENPPKPLEQGIEILVQPQHIILARRYSGYVLTESQWNSKAVEFKRLLKKAGEETDVIFDYYHGCGFSSPTQFFGRRNEVWYVKK